MTAGRPSERLAGWGMVALFGLCVFGVAAWNGHHDRRIADRLRRDGVEVDAEIVEYRARGRDGDSIIGSVVELVFQTEEGRRIETQAVVGTREEVGPTRIRYLRSDPSVARLVSDFEPRSGGLAFLVIFGAVFGLIAWGLIAFVREMDRQLGLR